MRRVTKTLIVNISNCLQCLLVFDKLRSDLSKMKFLNDVSTSPIRALLCCISQAMKSASVKKLFYYYGVYTGCCVGFNTVFSKLKCALVV